MLIPEAVVQLVSLFDRLRPPRGDEGAAAEANIRMELRRLRAVPDEAAILRESLQTLLSLPQQSSFYAESGVPSAAGFWLTLMQRVMHRVLPPVVDASRLSDLVMQIFHEDDDHRWVVAVADEVWLELLSVLIDEAKVGADATAWGAARLTLGESMRMLSHRLAGTALDRELLNADPALEQYESPFLAQNAALLPLLERLRMGGETLSSEEASHVEVLLDQCGAALDRVRRRARENGISVRLSYLLARLRQLVLRLQELLRLSVAAAPRAQAVRLLKTLVAAEQTRHHVTDFMGENVSLMARNITDHASRHGEHYIAEDRAAWRDMARSAAGGGLVIAFMALFKLQIGGLHLPPLTEGIVFGLNYGLGFVLIHLLGFTVATKQPAMTAAAIAATLEESRPRDLVRLVELVRNVVRTQFVAVLGNVGLAFPLACALAWLWPWLTGEALVTDAKAMLLLGELHPWASGALFFAAVAGVGLFLSGLVSGYFDNQARYHRLGERFAHVGGPRLGQAIDTHYGAVLGNLFFGMYLGLVGALDGLTGLPLDIRHVAFSSANLGTAFTVFDFQLQQISFALAAWALAGVMLIALVNLLVSFSLALYVAMKSRRQGSAQLLRLASVLLQEFMARPVDFFRPPTAPPKGEDGPG